MMILVLLLAVHFTSFDTHKETVLALSDVILENTIKVHTIQEKPQNVLCLEVGWQRIKAAVLPKNVTYDQLSSIRTISAPSKPWLNEKFPFLYQATSLSPLSPLLEIPPHQAALSISGPVIDNRYHPDLGKRGIPVDLKEACETVAQCEVIVENDVVCWAIGCYEILKLQSKSPRFPFLALTLGTGVGAALAIDEKTVYNIELTFIDSSFPRLRFLTREQNFSPRFTPHRALGKPYFDWKLGRREFNDHEVEPYLFNYNNRFQAFIEDVVEGLERLFSIKIQEILIGGGYSRFLDKSVSELYPIILMNPKVLEEKGISPDIVQLLGCLRLCQDDPPKTLLYPEYEEIEQLRQHDLKNLKECKAESN